MGDFVLCLIESITISHVIKRAGDLRDINWAPGGSALTPTYFV